MSKANEWKMRLPPPLPGVKPGKWRTRKWRCDRNVELRRMTQAQIEMSACMPYIANQRVEIMR